jgi:C-methyltransferase C-terminal domain/Methyltransferase domain/Putative zinc binding domain
VSLSKNSLCRVCKKSSFQEWLSLGNQPPANALLKAPSSEENFYPLTLVKCETCGLVQLIDVVDQQELFSDYVYYSSTSPTFIEHFKKFAQQAFDKNLIAEGQLIIDIGSNDGILLKPFKELGAHVLGVEPVEKIAKLALLKGIPTIVEWLSPSVARSIISRSHSAEGLASRDENKATLVTATNVFAHINDSDMVLNCVQEMLAPWGTFIIEVPYFWQMVQDNTFDLIYHEHLSYFSLSDLRLLAKRNGFSIIDVEMVPVHGGSLRVYMRPGLILEPSTAVGNMIEEEIRHAQTDMMQSFVTNVEKNKHDLVTLLQNLKSAGRRIVGYGAPAKMSTLTNYFGIDNKMVDYIVDDSEAKQNLFSPGMHIPIRSPILLRTDNPEYILIFAWNFKEDIMSRCRKLGFSGRFIIPTPGVEIL